MLMGDDVEQRKQFIQHQRQRRPLPRHLRPSDHDRALTRRHRPDAAIQPALTFGVDRADRDPGGDGAVLPRLRHVGHHVSRALPDVRDGLKPVHRRILWGMYDSRASGPTGRT